LIFLTCPACQCCLLILFDKLKELTDNLLEKNRFIEFKPRCFPEISYGAGLLEKQINIIEPHKAFDLGEFRVIDSFEVTRDFIKRRYKQRSEKVHYLGLYEKVQLF
jgi:hypothetical protein